MAVSSVITQVARWIVRHARAIALVSVLLGAISIAFTVSLYRNLHTDMEELLPKEARSVADLQRASSRLESVSNLAILIFSDHPDASKRFVIDLAQRIERFDPSLVARVEYRIDKEIEFFKKRRALFVGLDDLRKVRRYLNERIEYETALHNPLNIFRFEELPEPKLDLRSIESQYSHRVANFTKFKDGFYASKDEKIRVILVFQAGKASGITNAKKLVGQVEDAIRQLNPKSYAPDITYRFTGDVENLVEENASLVADLKLSATIVCILVTLAMILFYRDVIATTALVTSLFIGTLITFAVAYFTVGYLNANSAFLGSIVVGNGINFGIIFLARYVEERRNQRSLDQALETATITTMTSTLTAALAAGLSYGSLIMTTFRGFRQFGIIGMMGMIFCWVTAFTTLPALLSIAERWRYLFRGRRERVHGSSHSIMLALARLIQRASMPLLAVSLLLIVLSFVAAARFHGKLFETDTSRLRDKRSMEHGSGYLGHYLDAIFERYVSPIVILPETVHDTEEVATRLKDTQKNEGKDSLIASVYTMEDFVPKQQAQKISVLKEIRKILKPSIFQKLSPHDARVVREYLPPEAFKPFTSADLPKQILDRFKERDGTYGKVVLVEPVLDQRTLSDGDKQWALVSTLRGVADSVRPGTPVVGQIPLTVDMFVSVRHDGPRASAVAFAAVIVLVVALFRETRTVGLVLGSLLMGVTWFGGAILHWHLMFNFLNFIALPITFGIGVDYAVNVVQRYRIDGRGSILHVIRRTGGAVALSSLTTIIGYGSLILAGNRAFNSFGRLAILGEFTCISAAIISLPAWIYYWDSRQKGRAKRVEEEPAVTPRRAA